METIVLALLDSGSSVTNVGWLLILCVVAVLAVMEVKWQRSTRCPGGFREARRAEKSPTAAPEDITKDYMEVVLQRGSVQESWGLVWHVQGYKAQRFLVAGLEPNSPAGSCRQAQGLRGIRRGDELLSVNGKCQFQLMCQELTRAHKLSLQFLKADVVLPLDESSDEELCPAPRSPSIQADCSEAVAGCSKISSTSEEEVEDEPSSTQQQSSELVSLAASSNSPVSGTATVSRGRDAAMKRADAPVKKKSRRGEGPHFSSSASGSGSGSEQASCASKCPSTDWEYMMDNRPGSWMPTELQCLDRQVPTSGHTNNVVIVAGSPVIALQTANAIGTVVGGGVFHPMQNVRGRQQLPVLPSSQLAAAPVIHTDGMGQMGPIVAEPFVPQVELSPELQVPFPLSRQGSKESSGNGSAASSGVIFESQDESHNGPRAGSAPPGGCCIELPVVRKRTYRSGKKVRAKRTRAAIRAQQGAEAQAAETAAQGSQNPTIEQPEVKGSSSRSGSAPPSCHGGALKNPEPEENCLYYKPRRRAGKKVRQRMEHAIARRREQALMAEAAESCRMVSDDEAAALPPGPAPRARPARAAKRADSPVSTVSTAISTAAATVSAVASTTTTATTSEGTLQRRSFYARRPPLSGLPTMDEAAPETVPPRASQRNSSRARRNSAPDLPGGEVEDIIGRQVLLTGLVHAPQFNGLWGHVDGFDSTSQRYVLRVFTGQPGAKPKIAKLRRDCFIVPKGEVPSEAGQPKQSKLWQPSLRLGA